MAGLHPFTPEIREAERDRLVARLNSALPRGAVAATGPGRAVLAWDATPRLRNHGLVEVSGLVREGGAPTRPVRFLFEGTLAEAVEEALAMPPGRREATWTSLGLERLVPFGHVPDDPCRLEVLRTLADGMDAVAAMMAFDETVLHLEDAFTVPTGTPAGRRLHALLTAHPWLSTIHVRTMLDVIGRAPAATTDSLAHELLETVAERPVEPGLGERMVTSRRRMPPGQNLGLGTGTAAIMARVPSALFPRPLPGHGPYMPADLAELAAFHPVAYMASMLSPLARLDTSRLLGRVGSWDAYLARLAERAGVTVTGRPSHAKAAFAVNFRITEMAVAFATEVVAPAAMAVPGVWPFAVAPYAPRRNVLLHAGDDPVLAASYRILLGNRTLPALAELSARWHRRVAAISASVADADASLPGDGMSGPRLFEDLELDGGLYLTCLRSARELADEGSAGPDADGVPGLDHCVGSYLSPVRRGDVAIVSVRRRVPGGYERLSTAEVRFSPPDGEGRPGTRVVQHRGRGNGEPGPPESLALDDGLARVAATALAALAAHRASRIPMRGAAEAVHQAGAWGRIRDLWSFALTRPQRAMGPAELLRDAGFPAVPTV